jgi:hypothetical protein
VLAELSDGVHSPRIVRGSPYTSSATDICRSILISVRIPRPRRSAFVHCLPAWHMMAAFGVR